MSPTLVLEEDIVLVPPHGEVLHRSNVDDVTLQLVLFARYHRTGEPHGIDQHLVCCF